MAKAAAPKKTEAGPALWRYVKVVYADMDKGAEEMMVDRKRRRVWTGAITSLTSRHRISNPYYGPLIRCLRELGCVEMIRRGNSRIESQYVVLSKPTKAKFDEWYKTHKSPSQRKRAADIVEVTQQLNDLRKQVGNVNIAKGFVELHKRIDALTRRVDKIAKKMELDADD